MPQNSVGAEIGYALLIAAPLVLQEIIVLSVIRRTAGVVILGTNVNEVCSQVLFILTSKQFSSIQPLRPVLANLAIICILNHISSLDHGLDGYNSNCYP